MDDNEIDKAFSQLLDAFDDELADIKDGLELARKCRELQVSIKTGSNKIRNRSITVAFRSYRKLKNDPAVWVTILTEVSKFPDHKPRKPETETDKIILLFRFIFEPKNGYDRSIKYGRAASACALAGMKADEFGEKLDARGIEGLIRDSAIAVSRDKGKKAEVAKAEQSWQDRVQESGSYDAALAVSKSERDEAADGDSTKRSKPKEGPNWGARRDKKRTLFIDTSGGDDMARVTGMQCGQECDLRIRAERREGDGYLVLNLIEASIRR